MLCCLSIGFQIKLKVSWNLALPGPAQLFSLQPLHRPHPSSVSASMLYFWVTLIFLLFPEPLNPWLPSLQHVVPGMWLHSLGWHRCWHSQQGSWVLPGCIRCPIPSVCYEKPLHHCIEPSGNFRPSQTAIWLTSILWSRPWDLQSKRRCHLLFFCFFCSQHLHPEPCYLVCILPLLSDI